MACRDNLVGTCLFRFRADGVRVESENGLVVCAEVWFVSQGFSLEAFIGVDNGSLISSHFV